MSHLAGVRCLSRHELQVIDEKTKEAFLEAVGIVDDREFELIERFSKEHRQIHSVRNLIPCLLFSVSACGNTEHCNLSLFLLVLSNKFITVW